MSHTLALGGTPPTPHTPHPTPHTPQAPFPGRDPFTHCFTETWLYSTLPCHPPCSHPVSLFTIVQQLPLFLHRLTTPSFVRLTPSFVRLTPSNDGKMRFIFSTAPTIKFLSKFDNIYNVGILFAAVLDGPNVHFGPKASVLTELKISMTHDFSHCSALAVTHHTKAIPEMLKIKELM